MTQATSKGGCPRWGRFLWRITGIRCRGNVGKADGAYETIPGPRDANRNSL